MVLIQFPKDMNNLLSLGISLVAMIISSVTAWLTFFRKGELKMTQPTTIFFGTDVGIKGSRRPLKVFLRTLLYSTSQRGQTIESLHVNLQRGESKQNFSIWVYGEDKLVRGSGLFIPSQGVPYNHHFLLPEDDTDFHFQKGDYTLRVYSKKAGDSNQNLLATIQLRVSESDAIALQDSDNGLHFDWGPDLQAYASHIRYSPLVVGASSAGVSETSDQIDKLRELTAMLERLRSEQ